MTPAPPLAVLDVDIHHLPPAIGCLGRYEAALVLIRIGGRPAGRALIPLPGAKIDRDWLLRELLREAGSSFWETWLAHRLGVGRPGGPGRERATVAVCTRDRPDDLRRCLEALVRLPDDGQEYLVVDNAPATDQTRELLAAYPRVRYVREDRPGLDRARNRALQEARNPVVAFTDDDAVPDPGWLRGLLSGFTDHRVLCVTGPILPLELETPAQVQFERMGGLGAGMKRCVLDPAVVEPLAALCAGAGANMAIRRSVLDVVGPFDEALDVGTRVAGGGDVDLFRRVLATGYRIVREPDALVWHRHRRRWAHLLRLAEDYSAAGFAVVFRHACLERDPGALREARHSLTWMIRDLCRSVARRPGHEPRRLVLARIRGAALGPWRYVRSRMEVGRDAEPASRPGGERRTGERSPEPAPDGLRLRCGRTSPGGGPPAPGAEPLAGRHTPRVMTGPMAAAHLRALVHRGACGREESLAPAHVWRAVAPDVMERINWLGSASLKPGSSEESEQWSRLSRRLAASDRHLAPAARGGVPFRMVLRP